MTAVLPALVLAFLPLTCMCLGCLCMLPVAGMSPQEVPAMTVEIVSFDFPCMPTFTAQNFRHNAFAPHHISL